MFGIKMSSANSAVDENVKYKRLKKLSKDMFVNRENIKKYYDPKKHKYKDKYLYTDRILRKIGEK